jgi:hypothetical protein
VITGWQQQLLLLWRHTTIAFSSPLWWRELFRPI